jgi:hypothetical protein
MRRSWWGEEQIKRGSEDRKAKLLCVRRSRPPGPDPGLSADS